MQSWHVRTESVGDRQRHHAREKVIPLICNCLRTKTV